MSQSIFRIAARGEENTQLLRSDFTHAFLQAGGENGATIRSMRDDLHVPAGDRVVAVKIKGEPTQRQMALLQQRAYTV